MTVFARFACVLPGGFATLRAFPAPRAPGEGMCPPNMNFIQIFTLSIPHYMRRLLSLFVLLTLTWVAAGAQKLEPVFSTEAAPQYVRIQFKTG